MNKNAIIVSVVVVALLALGGFYVLKQNYQSNQSQNNQRVNSYDYQNKVQGKVVLGIKDKAGSTGAVSSVVVTVTKTELHSQSQGWITISDATQQFDLLALRNSGKISLVGQADVPADTYNQIRLTVSDVTIVDNGVQHQAKLPSGELKINGDVTVTQGNTATAVFDFLTDKSLHQTGSGQFIFTPVIKVETRSDAQVKVDDNNDVTVDDGEIKTRSQVGMDINGEIKDNFEVNDNNEKLDVEDGIINATMRGKNQASVKISAKVAENTAVSTGNLDTVVSTALSDENDKQVWIVSGLKDLQITNISIDAKTGAVIAANREPDSGE